MANESVMEFKKDAQDYSSFESELEQEYQKALKEGFIGTKEEYLMIRDYT